MTPFRAAADAPKRVARWDRAGPERMPKVVYITDEVVLQPLLGPIDVPGSDKPVGAAVGEAGEPSPKRRAHACEALRHFAATH